MLNTSLFLFFFLTFANRKKSVIVFVMDLTQGVYEGNDNAFSPYVEMA